MLKRTPLYEKHLALGAKMVPFAGWEMPVSYPPGIIAEHRAVREAAGVFDTGHMGLVRVNGHGALDILQRLTTNDVSRLEVNQCQYSLLCNGHGGVIDDILVYRLPQFYLLIVNAVNTEKVLAHLCPAARDGAKIDLYFDQCMIAVQGPNTLEIMAKIIGLPLDRLPRNHSLLTRNIIVSRTGYTGEDGVELVVSRYEVVSLWSSIVRHGVQPCGLGARDTLRLEAGLPLYGHEYDDDTSPLDAGYGWAVKFDKGDFVGKQALLAGPKKKLVGLDMTGRIIPRQGNKVFDEGGREIGAVTSGTFSPTFSKPIALAYLTGEGKPRGENVFIEIRGERRPARIVDKAFYKRVK